MAAERFKALRRLMFIPEEDRQDRLFNEWESGHAGQPEEMGMTPDPTPALFQEEGDTFAACLKRPAAGRAGQVTVVTVDGSRAAAAAIQAGKLHSTSAQSPRELGRIAAEKAYFMGIY